MRKYQLSVLLLAIYILVCRATNFGESPTDDEDEIHSIENLILSTRRKLLNQIPEDCQALFFNAEFSIHQLEILQRANLIATDQLQQYSALLMGRLQEDKNCDPEVIQKLFKKSVFQDNHLLTLKLLVRQLNVARIAESAVPSVVSGETLTESILPVELITTSTLHEPILVDSHSLHEESKLEHNIPVSTVPIANHPYTVIQNTEVIEKHAVPVHPAIATVVRSTDISNQAFSNSALSILLNISWIASILLVVGSIYSIFGSPEYEKLTQKFSPQLIIRSNYVLFVLAILIGKLIKEPIGTYFALLGCLGVAQAKAFAIRLENEKKVRKMNKKREEKGPHTHHEFERNSERNKAPGEINNVVQLSRFDSIKDITMKMIFNEDFTRTCLLLWLITAIWYRSQLLGYITVIGATMSVAYRIHEYKKDTTNLDVIVTSSAIVCMSYVLISIISYSMNISWLTRFFSLFVYGISYFSWPVMVFGLMYAALDKNERSAKLVLTIMCMMILTVGTIISSYIPSLAHIKNICSIGSFIFTYVRYFEFINQSKMLSRSISYLVFGVLLFVSSFIWSTWPQYFFGLNSAVVV